MFFSFHIKISKNLDSLNSGSQINNVPVSKDSPFLLIKSRETFETVSFEILSVSL